MFKILHDVDKNGEERPWRQKKLENLTYADYLEILEFKKAKRVYDCAETLTFQQSENGLKLYQTWFCKSRLCPLCNWRRTKKQAFELQNILAGAFEEQPKGRFLFLTLTEKNVYGEELRADLKAITQASNRLFKYKKVAKNLLGYVRSTELTVNEVDHSYHVHLHVLLFVKSAYFKSSDNYLEQAEWSKLWAKARKIDYVPVVNVQAVRAKGRKNSLLVSAQETAKYQVKSADYLTNDENRNLKIIGTLEKALRGTRSISYGGLLKEIREKLKYDRLEDDLIHTDDEEDETDEVVKTVVAKWNYQRKNYFIW